MVNRGADRHAWRPHAGRIAAVVVAIASLAAGQAGAAASAPDLPGQTPIVAGESAAARTAVSANKLRKGLAAQLRRGGGVSGAWVGDPQTGATLFAKRAGRPLQLASNMKLFTTATALARLGPDARFATSLLPAGELSDGVLRGDLVLRGGGDPSLTRQGLAKLANRARAAGLRRVTGRLRYDEGVFDRKRSVPQHGISGGRFAYLGRLSGLAMDAGRHLDPARVAGATLISLLRKRGVAVSRRIARGAVSRRVLQSEPIALVTSSPLRRLVRSTNTFSINYYAEMLLKSLAADARGRGTTRHGAAIARSFAREAGGRLYAVNGSGLSRADRASPRSVGALLSRMLESDEEVREAFIESLAVAGRTGTLARRMRGTAAHGRCAGKTGTLTGVSALSGYCDVGGGRVIAFSILMTRVSISRAHLAQDRMAALIARLSQ